MAIYKKPADEKATLVFSVYSFFQHFDRIIINALSGMIELYKKSENLSKQMAVFNKICYISHVNFGIMKILKMAKTARFFVSGYLM